MPSGPNLKQTKLSPKGKRFELEALEFFSRLAGRNWKDSETCGLLNEIVDTIKEKL